MIFLCFSGKDRFTIVSSIRHHLKNYGLDVWYDYHQYILGDDKVETYVRAIYSCQYAIVVFSPNTINSMGELEEIKIIKDRYDRKKIHVFPIFYNYDTDEIPNEHSWLCKLIYNKLGNGTRSLPTCNQIVCKILDDFIKENCYMGISDIKVNIDQSSYIYSLINIYGQTASSNLNTRISILYCLILYVKRYVIVPNISKSAEYLFSAIKLNIKNDFKEILIMEKISIILLNIYIRKYLPISE